MSDLVPSPYRGLFTSPAFVPREVFSVSQIEKAFGSAHEPDSGCLRSWAYRYLAGLKEPEYTYEQACQLPEDTEALKKLKGGIKKKTFGKVFHSIAERYYRGETIDLLEDAANRFFSGSHLAPHPRECSEIEIEKPIHVRTGPEGDQITWSGFKDLVVRVGGVRYLFDWKTTTPTVDARRNREHGKPAGAWTWQKDDRAIKIDYQANLYAYDELVNTGSLPRGRWIYFANSGKPDARATDYEPEPELVRETVRVLDGHARVLRTQIREYKNVRSHTLEANVAAIGVYVQPNLSNCAAFGGCPYRSSVGGPCKAENNGVIPVGALSRTITRPEVKPRPVIGPAFTFDIGAQDMNIHEQIAAAKAQREQGSPPAPSGFVPAGVPPHVPVFPAPTVPAPGQPPAAFNPDFAFGSAPTGPAWQPPPLPIAPPPAPPVKVWTRGMPNEQNPEYVYDGTGSWITVAQFRAESAQTIQTSPIPAVAQASVETFPSHVNPPEAANPNAPAAAPKRKPGRPKTTDTTIAPQAGPGAGEPREPAPTPADFDAPELTVTLKIGRLVVTVPAPTELCDPLQAYVLKQVSR